MTFLQARDAMFGIFRAAWGNAGPVAYPLLPFTTPSARQAYAKLTLRHSNGRQGSLGGELGQRRFDRSGILRIQIFAPVGDGMVSAYQLAQIIANAFEDAKLAVWFRNTRILEMGASGASEQVDVLTDFFYEEVR